MWGEQDESDTSISAISGGFPRGLIGHRVLSGNEDAFSFSSCALFLRLGWSLTMELFPPTPSTAIALSPSASVAVWPSISITPTWDAVSNAELKVRATPKKDSQMVGKLPPGGDAEPWR